jgi:chromate transport protein ChrA
MGLMQNLLIIIVHLTLVAADVILIMTILKIVHNRWRVAWIEPILMAVRPMMGIIMNGFATLVLRATGKSYPEKTLLVLLIISLLVMRFLVVSITK